MADKPKQPKQRNSSLEEAQARIPTTPSDPDVPANYATLLAQLKQRIREERLRVVMTANAAMVLLYWDIGRAILERQQREGWGAKVNDRLSDDLRREFPDMQGLSPRNLKYMRAFAAAWPDRQIVQEVLAQITWYHNIALLEKLDDPQARLWYARKAREEGWSRNVLVMHMEKKDFQAIECVIVPSQIVEAFEQRCEPLDDRIEGAEIESRTLATLRDALLPKLISGRLWVKDAERFLNCRGES